MKLKLFVLILAITALGWGQTANTNAAPEKPAQSSAADDATKAGCSDCCKRMGADKEGHGCCHDMNAKSDDKTASCCSGKDGKGCMGKDAKSCMKDGKGCCDMADGKGCCSKAGEDSKMAMACCEGKQCGKAHHHSEMSQ